MRAAIATVLLSITCRGRGSQCDTAARKSLLRHKTMSSLTDNPPARSTSARTASRTRWRSPKSQSFRAYGRIPSVASAARNWKPRAATANKEAGTETGDMQFW